MDNKKLFEGIVERIEVKADDDEYVKRSKKEARFFTRKRKLGFANTMFLSLNYISRPLFSEINGYYYGILKKEYTVEQQSYSEARQKIKYEAFEELFEDSVDIAMEDDEPETYKGFRLAAIDGTTIKLKYSEELKRTFGRSTPFEGDIYSRISVIYDVLNNVVLDARMTPFEIGERKLAICGLKHIEKYDTGKLLILMDRGYWSPEIFSQIADKGNTFLCRAGTKNVSGTEKECTRSINGKEYTFRCHSFPLTTGEIETLVTNLDKETVSDSELEQLYGMRWGVETKYDELKNLLKIDTLTSKTYVTVMQDFYATMLLSNIAAFASYIAQSDIEEKQRLNGNKYEYKYNRNVVIAALKDNMIAVVVAPSKREKHRNLEIIYKRLSQRPVPIRPGRSIPRPPRSTKRKKPHPRSVT